MELLLREGYKGPYVIWVREDLDALPTTPTYQGRYQQAIWGKAQSIFDLPLTVAIKDFQRIQGLTVDGIVGPKTWGKLEELVKQEKARKQAEWDATGKENVTIYNPSSVAGRIKPAFRAKLSDAQIRNAWVIDYKVRDAFSFTEPPAVYERLSAAMIASSYSESKLDAAIRNPTSGATGLFQVMSSFWGLHPTVEERQDPSRNTDLILFAMDSIRASSRNKILQAARRGKPIEEIVYLFCKYVEAANDRNTKMEWRRKIARQMFDDKDFED